ncbi:hypothetical protein PSTG_15698 [Puccinia striiformis f. sp. tritici PST-78]|uniref:Matrin-type domain-containing protein n=1 Tax=Puccinia striiformis f. sp. tritici PST-78 TaxID=1165861 RepID=A0A0L0UV08_9BASI|nr:hypothetical protein PSTG_15698 [Puccinia striiformis f. sp. tritici PST-78]
MTEFRVSKQSYFCKYCDIFIRDDKPSRAQHENGLRHKGNLERYIRDIYKKEDRAQKERADEASQVSKIERAAQIAHEQKDLPIPSQTEEKKDESNEDGGDEPQKRMKYEKQDWKGAENLHNYSDAHSLGFIGEEELEAATRAEEEEAQKRSTEGTMGKWEAVSKIQPTNNRLESSSNMINNRERIVSQLSINCDPDNKPIRRLFTERNLEVDTDILEGMEIKVKVDRRAKKHEEDDDHSGRTIHGSIQPIRLDGLSSNPTIKLEENQSTPAPSSVTGKQEEDIKPIPDKFQSTTTTQQPVFFRKRKATTQAQPRQKA